MNVLARRLKDMKTSRILRNFFLVDLVSIILILPLLLSPPAFAQSAGSVSFYVLPTSSSVAPGGSLDIEIGLEANGQPVWGVGTKLTFVESSGNVVDLGTPEFTPNSSLPNTQSMVIGPSNINNYLQINYFPGVLIGTAQIRLGVLHFNAINTGSVSVAFDGASSVVFDDIGQRYTIVNTGTVGTYNVTSASTYSISGKVFRDDNRNGIQDPPCLIGQSPPGCEPDWTDQSNKVSLTLVDSLGASIGVAFNSATDGSYRFSGLSPGSYRIILNGAGSDPSFINAYIIPNNPRDVTLTSSGGSLTNVNFAMQLNINPSLTPSPSPTLTPTPTLSPTPTPQPLVCNSVTLSGLNSTGTTFDGGNVYEINDLTSGTILNKAIIIDRTPSDAIVTIPSSVSADSGSSPGALSMTITTTNTGAGPAWIANIPSNRGTIDNSYSFRPILNTSNKVVSCLTTKIIVHPAPMITTTPTPTPPLVGCSQFNPGLSDTGLIDAEGRHIYSTSDYRGKNTILSAVRSPTSATLSLPTSTKLPTTAPNLSFALDTSGSGNYIMSIPDNNTIGNTGYNEYTVATNLISDSTTVLCYDFVLRVPNKPLDTTCPSTIASTQAKMLTINTTTGATPPPSAVIWSTEATVTAGESVRVAGFHNNQTTTFASDVILTAIGPEGPQSQAFALNNLDDTDVSNDNNVIFKPPLPGTYKITAITKGKEGENCTNSGGSTLAVNPVITQTKFFAISEDRTTLDNINVNSNIWQEFKDADGLEPVKISFTFSTAKAGDVKNVFIRFKSNIDTLSPIFTSSIKYIGPNPVLSNVNCTYAPSGGTTLVTIKGLDFGEQGNGTVKVGGKDTKIISWQPLVEAPPITQTPISTPSATPSSTSSGVKVRTNRLAQVLAESSGKWEVMAEVAELISGRTAVELVVNDGRKVSSSCTINTTTVDFITKLACRLPGQFATDNVVVRIYEAGSLTKPFLSQTVKIDANGRLQGFGGKLEQNKEYLLVVKAPKSLSRAIIFRTEDGGTTVIEKDIILPMGDIAPPISPDGKINALDKAELMRQWALLLDVVRSADLNGDSRVNSLDYSCMKSFFNKEDEVSISVVVTGSSTTPSTGGSSTIQPTLNPFSSTDTNPTPTPSETTTLFLNQNSPMYIGHEWFKKNFPEGILRSKLRSSSFGTNNLLAVFRHSSRQQ